MATKGKCKPAVVRISVKGGMARVTSKSGNVKVIITDHDRR
jgi:hypothetical protein